jgi:gas vesicle protein
MNDRTSDFTSFVSFLAGGLTGAALALLLAPESGEVARERIGRDLRDAADSARHLKDRVVRRIEEIGDQAAHRVAGAGSALAGNGPPMTRGTGDEMVST